MRRRNVLHLFEERIDRVVGHRLADLRRNERRLHAVLRRKRDLHALVASADVHAPDCIQNAPGNLAIRFRRIRALVYLRGARQLHITPVEMLVLRDRLIVVDGRLLRLHRRRLRLFRIVALRLRFRLARCRRFRLACSLRLRLFLNLCLRFVLDFSLRLALSLRLRFVLDFSLRLALSLRLRLILDFSLRLALSLGLRFVLDFSLRLAISLGLRFVLDFSLRIVLNLILRFRRRFRNRRHDNRRRGIRARLSLAIHRNDGHHHHQDHQPREYALFHRFPPYIRRFVRKAYFCLFITMIPHLTSFRKMFQKYFYLSVSFFVCFASFCPHSHEWGQKPSVIPRL